MVLSSPLTLRHDFDTFSSTALYRERKILFRFLKDRSSWLRCRRKLKSETATPSKAWHYTDLYFAFVGDRSQAFGFWRFELGVRSYCFSLVSSIWFQRSRRDTCSPYPRLQCLYSNFSEQNEMEQAIDRFSSSAVLVTLSCTASDIGK